MKKLNCILLIDDSDSDNFIHQRVIEKAGVTERIEVAESGELGLEFLNSIEEGKHPQPDLIFLDINMPGMNGWEFLESYGELDDAQKGGVVVVMLTTSANPHDRKKAAEIGLINDFMNKPLSQESLMTLMETYFPGRF